MYTDVYEMIALFGGLAVTLLIAIGVPLRYYANKKRIEEEHRTNNLALAYQILSARKEISLEEVKQLIILSGNSQEQLPQGYLPDRHEE